MPEIIERCPNCGALPTEDLIVPFINFFGWRIGTRNLSKKLGLKRFQHWATIPVSVDLRKIEQIAALLKIKLVIPLPLDRITYGTIGQAWICFGCGRFIKFTGELPK